MNVYILVLILGIWADAPWWFWALFAILFLDTGYAIERTKKQ